MGMCGFPDGSVWGFQTRAPGVAKLGISGGSRWGCLRGTRVGPFRLVAASSSNKMNVAMALNGLKPHAAVLQIIMPDQKQEAMVAQFSLCKHAHYQKAD